MTNSRFSGVVVPLSALYTKENSVIGDFLDLIPFATYAKKAGFSLIQLLPLNDTGTQSSPYSALSAFALHPLYIRLNQIENFDSLYKSSKDFANEYDTFIKENPYSHRFDYDKILNAKNSLLRKLYEQTSIAKNEKASSELEKWIDSNTWIENYAVYKNLKYKYMQKSWKEWDKKDKIISQDDIITRWNDKSLKKEHLFYAWQQFIADTQFSFAVKKLCDMGMKLKGDIPILMNEDSCDAWANPSIFNQNLKAGSPPDGDNPTGQNWGFPTYNWKNLKEQNYSWWLKRLEHASKYYDFYRLDHILGFFRIWAINENDQNALNGHTEPFAFVKNEDLLELGFDEDRLRWLSCPHIPTSQIQDITWNYENSHKILSLFCTKLPGEELWLFNNSVKGSKDFYDCDFASLGLCTKEANLKIKEILLQYWSNKTLNEVAKNKYVFHSKFGQSTSWASLSEEEKSKLLKLLNELNCKNEKVWKKQADDIFSAILSDKNIKMQACGEDLGVSIDCVPQIMQKHNIYSLKVLRWNRQWGEKEQPYVCLKDYPPMSVCTTSVHDSSTIRQWWNDEKQSIKALMKAFSKEFGIKNQIDKDSTVDSKEKYEKQIEEIANQDFSPKFAQIILEISNKSYSNLVINPFQDYLFLEKKYWLKEQEDERINIPGTVSPFNWTYRLPIDIQTLESNQKLLEKISKLTKRG